MSRCKSCGAEIIWIKMKSGKAMPCDAQDIPYSVNVPDDVMNLRGETLITKNGSVIKAVFDPDGDFYGNRAYVPHWATCPNANQHRKREMR